MKKENYTHRITISMDDKLYNKIENGAKAAQIPQVEYIQTHKIGSLEELQRQLESAEQEYQVARQAVQDDAEQIKAVNEEIHYLGQYYANKKTYAEFLKAPNKGAYRQAHQSQIDAYEQATAFLKSHYPTGGFPKLDELKTRRTELQKDQRHQKSQQQPLYNRMKELRIVNTNIRALLAAHTPTIKREPGL